jgi:hypothetical protein
MTDREQSQDSETRFLILLTVLLQNQRGLKVLYKYNLRSEVPKLLQLPSPLLNASKTSRPPPPD